MTNDQSIPWAMANENGVSYRRNRPKNDERADETLKTQRADKNRRNVSSNFLFSKLRGARILTVAKVTEIMSLPLRQKNAMEPER